MAKVTDNAFLILRVLYEHGAYADDEMSFEELERLLPLPVKDFDVADSYLLDGPVIGRTMGGDKGRRYVYSRLYRK
jgi:hypothetical protein